jgi:hypothetical protein
MWTTIVMILFIIIFFILIGVINQKEGFDNPSTISQQQQGDIATFRKKLNKITISDESLNSLQEQMTQLSNNTTKLHTNLPNEEIKQYI